MDYVFVKDFRVKAHIGVYQWEQDVEQTLRLDLKMQVDVAKAAKADDIHVTVNYFNVLEMIKAMFATERFVLVENAAERIATNILRDFDVDWLQLDLAKVNILPDAKEVGVHIERGKQIT